MRRVVIDGSVDLRRTTDQGTHGAECISHLVTKLSADTAPCEKTAKTGVIGFELLDLRGRMRFRHAYRPVTERHRQETSLDRTSLQT